MGIFQKLFGGPSKKSSDSEKWDAVLAKADLIMARDEIADLHKMWNEQAAKEGGEYCFKSDYVEAWNAFRESPTVENARLLLNVAPPLLQYFEMCSPGTDFYLTKSYLKKRGLA